MGKQNKRIESLFGSAVELVFDQISIFFFLLKLSAICTFWIVLMCWCQKWFLKNEKTSLACISAQKAIWKATTTTLPNTLWVCLLMRWGVVETVFYLNHNFKNQCVLWYCVSFCSCGLKKIVLQEVLLVEVCLVFIYVWLTLWLKLRWNKK